MNIMNHADEEVLIKSLTNVTHLIMQFNTACLSATQQQDLNMTTEVISKL